jgi:hypothetical protein
MLIYKRTHAGTLMAHHVDSPLPRKLRTLLIAIDGKSTVKTYVNSLTSFGDVEALLDSLRASGLIEDASGEPPQILTEQAYSTFETALDHRPIAALSQVSRPVQQLAATKTVVYQASSESLSHIVSLMSDFVTDHFSPHSLDIILSLESLQSIAEVKENMPGYAALIQPVGQAARDHLAALNAALNIHL